MAVCLDHQAVYLRVEQTRPNLRLMLMAASVLLIVLAFRVWLKLECTELGYQLAEHHTYSVELDMKRRELELERSVLARPDALARAAREKAGLGPANKAQFVKLSGN